MDTKSSYTARFNRFLSNSSSFTWIILGFSISYWFFFVTPVFLNSDRTMKFMEYVQSKHVIGEDLFYSRRASELQFIKGVSPYVDNNHYAYPPLDVIAFSPLLLTKASNIYPFFTLVNLVFFIFLTLLIPIAMIKTDLWANLFLLIVGTGLFSYGLQFELERGQFNMIAATVCFLAIWLYHHHPERRLLAYILFSISIQLKLFPLIFILMFVDNWGQWANNLKRFASIAAFNALLLLILGMETFLNFVKAVQEQAINPYIWVGNHSIASFTTQIATWMTKNHPSFPFSPDLLQLLLTSLVIICLILIILRSYRLKTIGVNPYLLLACTIASLLIPSSSHDYKLSILAAPVVIFLSNLSLPERGTQTSVWLSIPLFTLFGFLYSSTLFSYTNKPYYLDNNFPALLLMLLIVVVFAFVTQTPYQADA